MVAPNEAKVLQLFGDYVGTAKLPGLRWANPFFNKTKISLRVRNFESSQLKVNDQDGNPIDIAAVVVWRVVETAEAMFEVDDYENYVTSPERSGPAQRGHELSLRFASRTTSCRCEDRLPRSPIT